MQNLRIKSKGMGWPVGAVIPAHALSNGGADHIILGAVIATKDQVTHPVAPVQAPPASEAEAKIAHSQLVARVRDLEGELAGTRSELNAERQKCNDLAAENERLKSELEAATKVNQAKSDAETQAKLNAAVPLG